MFQPGTIVWTGDPKDRYGELSVVVGGHMYRRVVGAPERKDPNYEVHLVLGNFYSHEDSIFVAQGFPSYVCHFSLAEPSVEVDVSPYLKRLKEEWEDPGMLPQVFGFTRKQRQVLGVVAHVLFYLKGEDLTTAPTWFGLDEHYVRRVYAELALSFPRNSTS